jgi:hypothetical protein
MPKAIEATDAGESRSSLGATAQSKAGKQALCGYPSRIRLLDDKDFTRPDPCVSASGNDRTAGSSPFTDVR